MPVLRKQVEQILESAKMPDKLRLNAELTRDESTIVLGHPDDPFSSPARAYDSSDRGKKETLQRKPTRLIDGNGTPALNTGRTKLDSVAGSLDRADNKPPIDEHQSPLPLPVRIKSTFAAAAPAL